MSDHIVWQIQGLVYQPIDLWTDYSTPNDRDAAVIALGEYRENHPNKTFRLVSVDIYD